MTINHQKINWQTRKTQLLGQSRLNSYTINCRIVAARVYLLSVFMVLGMYSFGNRLDIFLTWIDFQFQYLGNISMSLYLIHEALLRWMIFACRGSVSWSNLSPEDFGSNLRYSQWGHSCSSVPKVIFLQAAEFSGK